MKQSESLQAIMVAIDQQLSAWKVIVDASRLDLISEYAMWAAPAAFRLNLTRYAEPLEYAQKLIIPTIRLLGPEFCGKVSSPVLDFGAGSSAIGITVAILRPDLKVELADRRQRVVDFAELCCARFGINNCRGHLCDLRTPHLEAKSLFSTVLVRAFGPISTALNTASMWLRPGGHIACWHQSPKSSISGLSALETVETGVPALQLTLYHKPNS